MPGLKKDKSNVIKWGISALSHDAALAVFKNNELVFASHSERYSRIKNDKSYCMMPWSMGRPKKYFIMKNRY